jgi:hypothetical protein
MWGCVCACACLGMFVYVYAYFLCLLWSTGERWVGARLRLDTVLSATSLDTCSARASYQVSETHLLHFLVRYFVASYSMICWDVAKVTYCYVYTIWCTHTPTYTYAWTYIININTDTYAHVRTRTLHHPWQARVSRKSLRSAGFLLAKTRGLLQAALPPVLHGICIIKQTNVSSHLFTLNDSIQARNACVCWPEA